MFTRIGLPLIALGMLIFAVVHVAESRRDMPSLPPPIQPARNPFPNTLAGAGMIEPETENISIGSSLPGVVAEVLVMVGQRVQPGEPLFRLDSRQLTAEREVRQALARSAAAELERIMNEPRPEKLRVVRAQLVEAQARLADARERWNRTKRLSEQRVYSEEEVVTREQNFHAAASQVEKAQAEVAMTEKGAWEFDKALARAAVEEAEAKVRQTETELDRLTVRAMVAGEVLQVNVRPGEFVGAPASQPLVVLGSIKNLHVRVDIDEYDIPRFQSTASARATLKGQPGQEYPLRFVRVEPFVIPKKSLTGQNIERVDTRVLQVIYLLDVESGPFFVGQQLDVFIDAD
jgi:multidrug resistance efflux pump